mmetsp:Transcript_7823/g.16283  ORF Transcript_7823/g.16283 Transcript_7823/m.16283 type:complete len:295 (+) Transcript_7823:365-1249(+)
MKYFQLLCCRPSSDSEPSCFGPYFTSQDFLSQEISSKEFLFHAASASAAADGGGDAEGLEVVGEFSTDGVRRGVLLSCPDGVVPAVGAGTDRVPRPPYQEFLSFDESLLHSLDARDDSILLEDILLEDDISLDASTIIPTLVAPLPDARDETYAPHTPPRRPAGPRRNGAPSDATARSAALPPPVAVHRTPCFRLFSEASFVEDSGLSDCRDEAVPAAPAHHYGRSFVGASCVSVLVDDRRDEEPPWMIGEVDATAALPRPLSDGRAVNPCMDAAAPKRKRSWKPRRLLVAIFK